MEFTSYRYRIYPNREQREFFELNFYCCTLVWNLMREDKARHYLESGKILQTTPAQYKKKYPGRVAHRILVAEKPLNMLYNSCIMYKYINKYDYQNSQCKL